MNTLGLDLSAIQGEVDFVALYAKGYRFVFLKCRQGNDGKDPRFDSYAAAAKAAGFTVLPYHFVYPLPKLDPIAQADLFLASSPGYAVVAVDFEWPDPDAGFVKYGCNAKQVVAFLKALCERLTEKLGRKPIIYVYPYFMTALIRGGADVAWMAEYPLWIASYTKDPTIPAPWSDWTFWQNDGNGGQKLPNGVDSDFDFFHGTEEELQAFVTGIESVPALPDDTQIIHPIEDLSSLALERDD